MKHDATIDLLATSDLLATCPPAELRAIARAGDVIHVDAGAVLSTPDDRPRPVLLALRGALETISADGVRAPVDEPLHGAAEALARIPPRDRVVAAGPAVVYVIDGRRLVTLVEDCPHLAVALLRRMALDHCAA